ncbi:hypothetical protein GCU56_22055 [Geodermatophilus sabuli]|uniref:Uncharacterized protein n=1 Tax=Geodermatophilus sabuli TaxID=1564158 RepID=A0A7K3W6Q5_9ACTN|nr:hypothetical protein [Geodermatophilus sabuli]NEK60546.1 hypothetical protein [Geodermatophilus sabuli]
MSTPTPSTAAALLARAADADARVRRDAGSQPAGFLAVLGCASAGLFLAQPVADGDRGVLAAAVVFGAAVLGAVLVLVIGRRSTRYGFSRRFGLAMGAWAAVFAVGLAVGTTAPGLAHRAAFWVPLALLVAVPGLVGAWRELPR